MADYLANARDRGLKPMIDAAMQRHYSGSPAAFFTGGGVHAYANFEKWEDHSIFSVADGFAHSINNVFIRIMRDLVHYYIAQSGEEKLLSAARDDPEREAFLRRFIDQESKVYLSRFYRTYHGLSPEIALRLIPILVAIAVLLLSCWLSFLKDIRKAEVAVAEKEATRQHGDWARQYLRQVNIATAPVTLSAIRETAKDTEEAARKLLFALPSPVRPDPVASSIVELVAIDGITVQVRGLDCLDGTPLIDLKPERGASE